MTRSALSRAAAIAAAEKIRLFAQPQRLMILSLLLGGEKNVSEIDAATQIGQPALSQQLAELRRADMLKTRRAARQVYYSLANPTVEDCVWNIERLFSGEAPAGPRERSAPTQPKANARDSLHPVAPRGAAGFAKVLG
jgi:DNA-binding transcriptional ArsR family regulator